MRLREFKKLRVGQRVYKYRGWRPGYGKIERIYDTMPWVMMKDKLGHRLVGHLYLKHHKNESLK